jgi:hypothetical protein
MLNRKQKAAPVTGNATGTVGRLPLGGNWSTGILKDQPAEESSVWIISHCQMERQIHGTKLFFKAAIHHVNIFFYLWNQTTNHRAYKIPQFNFNPEPIVNSPSAHTIFLLDPFQHCDMTPESRNSGDRAEV